MSDIPAPIWSCEFFPLKDEVGAAALDGLTVGAKFGWKCHGDLAVQWPSQAIPKVTFAKPEDVHSLAILKVVRQDPNDVQYVVTAYKAGEHAPEYARVLLASGTGTEVGFEATAPKWTVKSVLNPQTPAQPYGPLGPWQLSLPLWFIIGAILFLIILAVSIYRKVRKYNQRRRMLEDLKRHSTAMRPLHQFYRDARQLRRRLNNVKEPSELGLISADLDREFRLYIVREFQIPALEWSTQAILKDLRQRHRKTYQGAGEPLRRTLRELSRLKSRSNIATQDVEQMQRMSLDAAERLQNASPKGHA